YRLRQPSPVFLPRKSDFDFTLVPVLFEMRKDEQLQKRYIRFLVEADVRIKVLVRVGINDVPGVGKTAVAIGVDGQQSVMGLLDDFDATGLGSFHAQVLQLGLIPPKVNLVIELDGVKRIVLGQTCVRHDELSRVGAETERPLSLSTGLLLAPVHRD